jgi:hypothetical protein
MITISGLRYLNKVKYIVVKLIYFLVTLSFDPKRNKEAKKSLKIDELVTKVA